MLADALELRGLFYLSLKRPPLPETERQAQLVL